MTLVAAFKHRDIPMLVGDMAICMEGGRSLRKKVYIVECCLRRRFGHTAHTQATKLSPIIWAALLSSRTATRSKGVLGPADGDVQLLRNIVKRGDKMGTSTFRIV